MKDNCNTFLKFVTLTLTQDFVPLSFLLPLNRLKSSQYLKTIPGLLQQALLTSLSPVISKA